MHLPATLLINDLEASAWGIGAVAPKDLIRLNRVAQAIGNQAIIAPGTGLGGAGLFWDGSQHQVVACEGGHREMGPQGGMGIELLHVVRSCYARVSYERAISVPGVAKV